ncbi:MAG: hypothetical protein JST00_18130 [Deltaproteobacteria bacterium]|nr:hypothetical protein [Deltaproteobacteria bacterium]
MRRISFLSFSVSVGALLAAGSSLLGGCESDSPSTPVTTEGGAVDGGGGGGDDANVPSTCAPVTGSGTTHDKSLEADETWTAAGSPHVVTAILSVPAGKTLTIEPCAVVQVKPPGGLLVTGKLSAEGAADKRIQIGRADAATAWRNIETRKGAEVRLAYTTIEGGGDPNGGRLGQFAMLDVRGDQDIAPQPILFVDHVTVKGSGSLGIWMREGGGFAPGSNALTVTGGTTFPMTVWGRAAGGIPGGSYTGNATDEIFLPANGGLDDIQEDTTLGARGVPYRVGGELGGVRMRVQSTKGVPLLTIEPGVTMRFGKNVALIVETASTTGPASGALKAEGTADKPIVFTSAEATPAAGDWTGIVLGKKADPRTKISNAKISYAGGPSGISSFDCPSPANTTFSNEGAILVIGDKPDTAFVTNTTIEQSAGDGIVRGWTGDPVDFLGTNTFANVARCQQTFPKPSVGVCPNPAPCPK